MFRANLFRTNLPQPNLPQPTRLTAPFAPSRAVGTMICLVLMTYCGQHLAAVHCFAAPTATQKRSKSLSDKKPTGRRPTVAKKSHAKTDAKNRPKSRPGRAVKSKQSGRLPKYFSRLDLSKEQRATIQQLQSQHQQQLAKLRKEMERVTRQQQRELEKVLTAAQKRRLRKWQPADDR